MGCDGAELQVGSRATARGFEGRHQGGRLENPGTYFQYDPARICATSCLPMTNLSSSDHGLPDSFAFDGVELGPSTDYIRLTRQQLADGSLWPSGAAGPSQGGRRVIDAAEGSPSQGRLFNAALRLLADGHTAVPTAAHGLAP